MKNTSSRERIRGSLYGVAVGDALGAPLEFLSAEVIRKQHGTVTEMIGGGWLNVQPGEITDDTQMTLAVAEGILDNPQDPVVTVGERFIKWFDSRPKDVGATCSSSIRTAITLAAERGTPNEDTWLRASQIIDRVTGGYTAGNGSLMRTAYCGLYYGYEDMREKFAYKLSRMTHWDEGAAQDCVDYSNMLFSMTCEDDQQARKAIIRKTVEAGNRYDYETLSSPSYQAKTSGYLKDSFATALHCIFTTDSFEDAVVKAVNLGGDADTIGAITGGMAGALYGYEAIPARWREALDAQVKIQLDYLADCAANERGIPEDREEERK